MRRDKPSCLYCHLTFALIYFLTAGICLAEFTWLPTESTYDGTPFSAVGQPGMGMTGGATPAYGGGVATGETGVYAFGFTNEIPVGGISPQNSDLSSTPLVAGTDLVLVFQKGADDEISFLAMMADRTQDIGYKVTSSTRVQVTASVVNPVQSASGDLGAAFGVIMVTTASGEDFGGTLFSTDMFYQDIEPPADASFNGVSINANGIEGVEANFDGFIPASLFTEMGVSSPNDIEGYIDGSGVSVDSFTYVGQVPSGLFQFLNDADPVIHRYNITNSDWSKKDVQFGVLDNSSPTPTPSGTASPTATPTSSPTSSPTASATPTLNPERPLALASDVSSQVPKNPVLFYGVLRNKTKSVRIKLKCRWKASKKVRKRTGKRNVVKNYRVRSDTSGQFSKTVSMKTKPLTCQAHFKKKKSEAVKVTVAESQS